ncbi:hypothetical protein G6M78_13520 [Agrobacterium tumefaciens]|uniref:hypothetical protein n=1 Tax=Agrobacterium tumefaciens TaxID=358 RepID=UPI001571BB82|nr:hypothetical protein [Agrobacterium tumefaciens]NTE56091.1 hypothetical protein [Agrobacterium tumefaciens]NTE74199.1 hypothetical protein [Agrobacterium tumefaciens]
MTQKKHAIDAIVKAFDAFRNAYDEYLFMVETAIPEEMDDEALTGHVRSLVLGSEDVGIYLRDYGYTVDSLRSLARQ